MKDVDPDQAWLNVIDLSMRQEAEGYHKTSDAPASTAPTGEQEGPADGAPTHAG